MSFVYEFEWDRSKASANVTKHAVDFKLAATVFKDPLAATIFDGDHSGDEQRWVTIGKDEDGRYILVVHTFQEVEPNRASVRIISARRPTKPEIAQYEETYQ
ncbi:MAG TPA: hypothetical protein DEH78_12020 [Solibacterales bacterium]|nr:hypothetical protein [Bryobacterales bacterium]